MDIEKLEKWAADLGFKQFGVCSVNDFSEQKVVVEQQPKLKERKQLRYFPKEDYPNAKSLLVLLYPYMPAQHPNDEDSVFIDSYYDASNRAYHAAELLEKRILDAGYFAKANVSYPAKTAAIRAGLGFIGDHGLLITPEYGTRVVIILIATDAVEPKETQKCAYTECLHCGKCEEICPADAIDLRDGFDPSKCLRNFILEGIVVPENVRSKIGRRFIGCDSCQNVCPMQPQFPEMKTQQFKLRSFLTTDEAAFKASCVMLGEQIGRNAARPQRIRAQAALLAGSMKREDGKSTLQEWSNSEFDAVRIHAQWALEQLNKDDTGA